MVRIRPRVGKCRGANGPLRRGILAAELTPGVFWQEVAFEWRLGWYFEQQGESEQDGEREHMGAMSC